MTTAYRLHAAGVDVCLLEADREVGGCMRTETRDGFLLEKGPFNVIIREPAFEALLEDLSSAVTVVGASPSARVRFIYHHGSLHAVPSNPFAFATTKLLTLRGRARLLLGVLASRRATDAEETIEQVASRRFGADASDTLVSAVIAGIFAGDISRLSLAACFPTVARIDATSRSLLLYGLRAALRRKKAQRRWRGLVSMEGGLGALARALGKRLGADLLTAHSARAIRATDDGFEVDFRDGHAQIKTLRCRRLVIGSSATQAAELLRPLLPEASNLLNSIQSVSLVVLNLGFRKADVGHPMDGFGFVVPRTEPQLPLMGVLWADSIFPHHAPLDHRLIRVFMSGAREPAAVEREDDALLGTAMDALRDLLDLRRDPVLVDICRHRSAIPQYYCGHREKIARLGAVVSGVPGLYLVGNYLEGVSVNDCVRCGTRIADEIIESSAPTQPASPTSEPVTAGVVG